MEKSYGSDKHVIIREYRLRKAMDLNTDPAIGEYISKLGTELGEEGRFVVKQKGIGGRISILAETEREKAGEEMIAAFEEYLKANDLLSEDERE